MSAGLQTCSPSLHFFFFAVVALIKGTCVYAARILRAMYQTFPSPHKFNALKGSLYVLGEEYLVCFEKRKKRKNCLCSNMTLPKSLVYLLHLHP